MRQRGHGLADYRQFRRLNQLILHGAQVGFYLFALGDLLFKLPALHIELAQRMT
ncbi:Uncharacterised protein [Salmonella enterica subsp. enterica serovar Typhi]|nr:Uncharacterised protein [Salmonella enterica subsp. enterica serovar Typhi]